MQEITDEEKIKAMLLSGHKDTIDLALLLAKTQGINLTDFWKKAQQLAGIKQKHPSQGAIYQMLERASRWYWTFTQRRYIQVLDALSIATNTRHLDVSQNHHVNKDLPDSLRALTQMRHLNLQGNRLKQLPDFLRAYALLDVLQAQYNDLERLPDWLPELHHLRHLWLNQNPHLDWEQAWTIIFQMPQLEYLKGFCGTRFRKPFHDIEAISVCNRWNPKDKDIEGFLRGLRLFPRLRKLRLGYIRMEHLSEAIGDLIHLEELQIMHASLATLPESLCRLPRLRKLSLRGNYLEQLPENLGDLKQLEFLSLRECHTHAFPQSANYLTRLRRVDLRHCYGQPPIPQAWKQLPHLVVLQ